MCVLASSAVGWWQEQQSECRAASAFDPAVSNERLDAVVDLDRQYMQQALELAKRAEGQTHPNPAVGCVIVKDGQVRAGRARPACSGVIVTASSEPWTSDAAGRWCWGLPVSSAGCGAQRKGAGGERRLARLGSAQRAVLGAAPPPRTQPRWWCFCTQVVGEGFHPKAGMPHAEVYALRGAGAGQRRRVHQCAHTASQAHATCSHYLRVHVLCTLPALMCTCACLGWVVAGGGVQLQFIRERACHIVASPTTAALFHLNFALLAAVLSWRSSCMHG